MEDAARRPEAGKNAAAGLAQGMRAGIPDVVAAGKELGDAAKASTAAALDAHSPSREYARLGAFSAQGYTEGVEGGTPVVRSAVGAMVAPPSSSSRAAGGRGRGGAGPFIEHLYVSIERSKADGAISESTLKLWITRALEEAARSIGAPVLAPESA